MYGVYMSIATSRTRLDRSRVVQAATELADERGLDAASMRGVAERLGVTPMALYKHVDSRSQLIDEMLDALVAGISVSSPTADWREAVRARVLSSRAILLAHPWMRDAIESRPLATAQTLAHMDALMAAMFDGGLSADLVHHAMHALSTRMWGFTRDALPTPQAPSEPAARAQAMAEFALRYPAIMRMATTAPHAGDGCDDDAEFVFALDLILDGVQRLHDAGWHSVR